MGIWLSSEEVCQFANRNRSVSVLNKLPNKIAHAANEAGCYVRKYISLVVYFKS